MKSIRTFALVGTLVAGTAGGVLGQAYPEFERGEEIRLAMSAGPPTVSQHADVYLFGPAGFEKAIDGTNGWACLVVRVAANRSQLAPHCLNPFAEQSVLPAFLLEAELQRKGWDQVAITAEMDRQFASGDIPTPSGPAYAYMLSKGQRLGSNGENFKPHFMLYVPNVTNADIGGDPSQQQFPFVGPVEGHPLATVVIIMDEFVDPAAIVIPDS